MRLIDADAMLERNKSSIYDTTDLEEMLKYEPTAYGADKVLEKLENEIKELEQHPRGTSIEWHTRLNTLKEVVAVIKKGGGVENKQEEQSV